MERIREPELMNEPEQAYAYATADFEQPHSWFIEYFRECFKDSKVDGRVLDLGCGPGDITIRFARAFPGCLVDGVDGAEAMLRHGHDAVRRAGFEHRVRLIHGLLPQAVLPVAKYDAVISNSLLHHLANPMVMWDAIKKYTKPGAPVFVMDLMRPDSRAEAASLMEQYSGGEPDVLKKDFFNSLLAAYRVEEVQQQLRSTGVQTLRVMPVSDRHLVIHGFLPEPPS
jgi:cyclopropane fatty-acyl-phospholipid synthase-like methyltransferase